MYYCVPRVTLVGKYNQYITDCILFQSWMIILLSDDKHSTSNFLTHNLKILNNLEEQIGKKGEIAL